MAIGGLTTSLVLGLGGLIAANVADATQTMTPTTWVNMRTGPSASDSVVRVLSPSETVKATGKTSGKWYQVKTTDDLVGWVYGTYLSSSSSTSDSSDSSSTSTTGTVRTTSAVNVRKGPSTSYAIVGVASKGMSLSTTGKTSGSWTQVVYHGTSRWISSNYLTTSSSTTATATGKVKTTANLYLRTGGSMKYPYKGVLPAHSIVDTTGKTTSAYTQIIYKGSTYWIATRYTTSATATTTSTTPTAAGKIYVTVGALYVRSSSASNSTVVGTVHKGAKLLTTGKKTSTRTQVIYRGAKRWVYSAYVSTTKPSTNSSSSSSASLLSSTSGKTLIGMSQLNSNATAVVNAVLASYPKITNIYGWRASSSYSSDHPSGRAVDIMIPSYKKSSSISYGWTIAHYFQKNAAKYNVKYIIYRQKVWNAAYPDRGWRAMEDRGSDTANHMDHVHVSVTD